MDALTSNPVFLVYIASAIALGLNLLFLANNTALTRAKASEAVNPEDRALNKDAKIVYEAGNERTERYRRAHRNALENIPLFLITGFVLTLTPIPLLPAAILFGVFVVARFAHTLCYLNGYQPYRTASFVVAALDQVALLGFLGYFTFAA